MKLNIIYPIWGSEHLSLETFIGKVKEAGYDGIEMNVPFDNQYTNRLQKLLDEKGLLLIAQQWLAPQNESVDDYIFRMMEYLYHLASLRPLFINSHTGKDFFTFEENCRIFEISKRVSDETGVKVVHETHRGRALFSTFSSGLFFERYPDLRINADFSHWCCVAESLLEGHEDVLNMAIKRADYIHARIGFEQGPQVNHPKASEHEKALKSHLTWWKRIILNARQSGQNTFSICTEFGPEPYLQTLPFTGKPVADQWAINQFMKELLIKEMNSKV